MSASKPDRADSSALQVRLYVAGESPNSTRAVTNLRAALAELGRSPDSVEIIDVLRSPERGFSDGVLVTPMLVRVSPAPERRILGNLSDRALLDGVLSSKGASDE